jgi:putative hydrolase of the HAD superfamily
MKLADFKVITFDVVGTLIDFEAGILNYMRPIVQAAGIDAADDAILEAYGRGEVVAQGEHPDSPFPPLLDRIYRVAAEELGIPAEDAQAAGLRQSIPDWPAFPDSVEALKRLRRRYRLVAVTNSDNWALSAFARTLGEPFDDKISAEMAGASKPDPRVFEFCLKRQEAAGFRKQDILHTAQSQYHDIGVAHRLGYATCWIERRMGKVGTGGTPAVEAATRPDWHFPTLAALADAVDAEGS